MSAEFEFSDSVVLVTGVGGALGSATAEAFLDAGATVCGVDLVGPDDDDFLLETPARVDLYQGDFTDETDVADTVDAVVERHGGLDALANIAGTWRGGDPVHETDTGLFDLLFDVNLKTAFLASKHAIPHLREREGTIVSVASRSSLSGGEGDALYRASKAGVRLLTESIAEENSGTVRANAVLPSVIDTPMNRSMMPDADYVQWADPADVAAVMLALCSDITRVTSGAAVPVYGES
jgi:NAD(P)-dependent dehydrogenase (short-subunit alcohol dehydrogenase family)